LKYNTDLFTQKTIEGFLNHFKRILQLLPEHMDCKISELPLLSQKEQQQILYDWNQTQSDYPKNQCIHHLFENQVDQSPDAIAITCKNKKMTYWALNARANGIASQLIEAGAGPNQLVGICMHRSIDMVAGLLAILKSGSAYVPLDPAFPEQRLQTILSESQAKILLGTPDLLDRFSSYSGRNYR